MHTHFRWSQTSKSAATAVRLGIPKARARGISIPAYESRDGTRICHGAGACIGPCFARDGRFRMSGNQDRFEHNLELFKTSMWANAMIEDLTALNLQICRIHDGGDYFSDAYLNIWMWVASKRPLTRFYGYSKDIPMLIAKWKHFPPNMKIAQSYGGKWDSRIIPERSHSKIFASEDELYDAGYENTAHDDVAAVFGCTKIGLVLHGQKAKSMDQERLHVLGFLH